jgi:rhomboid protease GluP
MHLIMNTFALLYIGMFLEPLIGKYRFLAAYILTGICAGLMSITMHPASVGVGASGAIFGMYGVFLSLLTTNYIQKSLRKTMLRSILFFVLLNLLYGLEGNTDNAAHIGGLLSGIIIGLLYRRGVVKG